MTLREVIDRDQIPNGTVPTDRHEKRITCPRCKKADLYERVPRAMWVKTILFFLPLKRYKCNRCGKRSYVLS